MRHQQRRNGCATGNESSRSPTPFSTNPVANTVTSLNSATINLPAGFVLSSACGINDAGQVTGYGLNSAGKERAFLLTPVPVPEPSALLLAASGLAGLLAYAWRKRK